jgi:predicted Zn-dependent protease
VKPPQDVVEEVLTAAGGDCVVLVEESSEAEVRFANNTTTTNGVRLDRRVTVVQFAEVAGGVSAGIARRGGDVDASDLAAAAGEDARGGPPADDAQPLLAGGEQEGFGDDPARTDLGSLAGALASLAGAFQRARTAGRVLSGFAEHRVATTYLGTSTGVRRRHVQPTGALHLVGRSEDGTSSAWAGAAGPSPADAALDDLEERVNRGLAWAGRRVDLDAGRYEVVLPPAAVADLMVGVAEAAGGREAEEGRTVFAAPDGRTRVGDKLSPLPFDLWSDPTASGLECVSFLATAVSSSDVSVFDNGLPIERVDWIRGGALHRLRYHRAGAARSGVAVTPPVDNLVLELPGATGDVDDMVARTEHGLLLTCLWYIREVDPSTLLLTGLTRDGVYVVEDGRVVGAANNFRFNESPVDLLARATEAGATGRTLGREFGEWVNRTRMPPLRIPDFNMSSVSQAS